MAATRHAWIEAQYAKTTTTYSPPKIYMGGWAKVMLMIGTTSYYGDICQGYKYNKCNKLNNNLAHLVFINLRWFVQYR